MKSKTNKYEANSEAIKVLFAETGLTQKSIPKWVRDYNLNFSLRQYQRAVEGKILKEEVLNGIAVFFDKFFTALILVDVILLLISFFYTDQFHKIIRNSGFIISTILIRMSFGVNGLISTILILVAVLFGLAIIRIHNSYEKNELT